MKKLHLYPIKKISEMTLKKFLNHLYYLSEESVLLSLFDESVSKETKSNIIHNLLENENEDNDDLGESSKKLILNYHTIESYLNAEDGEILANLVSSKSMNFFTRFLIPEELINIPVDEWAHSDVYNEGKKKIMSLKVVNDAAERAIKLLTDFHKSVTKDASQQAYYLPN